VRRPAVSGRAVRARDIDISLAPPGACPGTARRGAIRGLNISPRLRRNAAHDEAFGPGNHNGPVRGPVRPTRGRRHGQGAAPRGAVRGTWASVGRRPGSFRPGARDRWIGRSDVQRTGRRHPVADNCRFAVPVPGRVPNLVSRMPGAGPAEAVRRHAGGARTPGVVGRDLRRSGAFRRDMLPGAQPAFAGPDQRLRPRAGGRRAPVLSRPTQGDLRPRAGRGCGRGADPGRASGGPERPAAGGRGDGRAPAAEPA